MPEIIHAIPIDLGGVGEGAVLLTDSVVKYFNISTTTTTAQTSVTRRRAGHKRTLYNGLTATINKTINVPESTWEATPSAPEKGAGRLIRVPTELKTAKGLIRMVTMRFPNRAVTGAISKFLFEKCIAHKPTYFIMPSGKRHLVLAVTGNVNPEPVAAPAPEPTP